MSKVRSRLRVEVLEGREVPAATGFPWGNAGHLTLSFAPDGTDIGGQASAVSAAFANSPGSQADVLRAFQTWAVLGNINIAVQPDQNLPTLAFGTPGARQGDPRFGDIRIGAAPVQDADLAIAAPHDPFLAGTWSGDVVFDSGTAFGPGGADVFSVALHEAGHALGLDHSADPKSAMAPNLAGARTGLAASDVKAARALYGTRAGDRFEGATGNGPLALADGLNTLGGIGFDGSSPIALYADITSLKDRDTFAFRPQFGYAGPMTIRVQTAGVSLLAPTVTVYDQGGKVVQTATGDGPAGSTVKVTLDSVIPGRRYYVRVESGTKDVFGIGTYAMAVTYDNLNRVDEATIDRVLRGPYRTLTTADLQLLFHNPDGLVHDDHGHDDSEATASRLQTTPGYRARSHYEVLASVSAPAVVLKHGGGDSGGGGGGGGGHGSDDLDNYRLRTPTFARNQVGVLTATVWSLSGVAPPTVTVLDAAGHPLPADILANGNGTYTVQAVGVKGDRDYLVQLDGAAPGNYSMAVDLTTRQAALRTFAQGALPGTPANAAARALYVAQGQVFDFLLSAPAADPAGTSVQLLVIDSTGATVYTLTAAAGHTVSGPAVFLPAGDYAVVIQGSAGATGYTLRGAGLTIPIGPIPTDPTTQPVFTSPDGTLAYPAYLGGYDPYLANLIETTYGLPAPTGDQTISAPPTDPYMMLPLAP